MRIGGSKDIVLLIIGDAVAFIVSLVLTLSVRYGEIPSKFLLSTHLPSFLVLIAIFIVAGFSAGLYDKQAILFRGRGQWLLLKTQIFNAVIGVVFFYFAPVVIAPKANLFIYFIISTALLFLWRMVMLPVFIAAKKQNAIVVGDSADISDLVKEINGSVRYPIFIQTQVKPQADVNSTAEAIKNAVASVKPTVLVVDLHDRAVESSLPLLYSLIFSGVSIIDASRLYESVFDRIPLSLVGERWLVENSATAFGGRRVYDVLKRMMDIVVSFVGGVISLVFYPFVYVAIKMDDKGPIFIRQERVGKNGKKIMIVKFRSMTGNDQGKYGSAGVSKNVVTRVGKFLRTSRLDELPQFWNVLVGDLSLVGPRPELPHLVGIYEKEIPYYNVRHLVEPGLFGWAQIYHEAHPHHEVATEETKNKLSYDLFYIKNRSLGLDFKIALRTIQILLRRAGK